MQFQLPRTLNISQNAIEENAPLQKLIEINQKNAWDTLKKPERFQEGCDVKKLRQLNELRNEILISSDDDTILRGRKIVIPRKLRPQAINLALVDHQGLVKTKKLIHEKVPCKSVSRNAKQTRSIRKH